MTYAQEVFLKMITPNHTEQEAIDLMRTCINIERVSDGCEPLFSNHKSKQTDEMVDIKNDLKKGIEKTFKNEFPDGLPETDGNWYYNNIPETFKPKKVVKTKNTSKSKTKKK